MKDYPVPFVLRNMAKLIIWIVKDSSKFNESLVKYAVNKVFQHNRYRGCGALRLTKGRCIIVCWRFVIRVVVTEL